ncbi:SLC13 family permease [Flammeovirgaceae bacterium SG7u.111]|nr:SLC13 family permease [Flammeovirgaceae bacterium SG7u.132]WPO36139.1 SLC13 family permease [Flammeovirgaceae bacterium SG7u.111]
MDFHQAIVLLVLAFIICSLFFELLKPAITFFVGIALLLLFGTITPTEFLVSCSNQHIATIIMLILVTAAVRKNLGLEYIFDRMFRKAATGRGFLWRMTGYVALLSSCMNNTPVVSMMTPYVYRWGKKNNVSPSKLLIPLSYATILGGMLTAFGTSTNLVLNGFLSKNGITNLVFSDFFHIGIAVLITGLLYLCTFGYNLLPARVPTKKHEKQSATSIDEEIQENDAIIKNETSNVKVKETKIRKKNKLDEDSMVEGDLLLLSIDDQFFEYPHLERREKLVRGMLRREIYPKKWKFSLLIIGILLATGYAIAGAISLFTALIFMMGLIFIFNLFTIRDISKTLDIELVILLVSAITLGNALITTGTAELISSLFIKSVAPLGNIGLLISLFITTALLTSFITNVAALSITFPVAYAITQQLGLDGTPFYLAIAFAASAAFISPIGYQTNWMVYAPGRYVPKDYSKAGFPLLLIYGITSLTMIIIQFDMLG